MIEQKKIDLAYEVRVSRIIKGQCKSKFISRIIIPPNTNSHFVTHLTSRVTCFHHISLTVMAEHGRIQNDEIKKKKTTSPSCHINPLVIPQPAASHASTKSPLYQINPLITPQPAASHASTTSPSYLINPLIIPQPATSHSHITKSP